MKQHHLVVSYRIAKPGSFPNLNEIMARLGPRSQRVSRPDSVSRCHIDGPCSCTGCIRVVVP